MSLVETPQRSCKHFKVDRLDSISLMFVVCKKIRCKKDNFTFLLILKNDTLNNTKMQDSNILLLWWI